ncbi:MAG: extracellular solute-binding protein [Rhodobacteraceae bacterium]|nr:extracellular solute-binding protein [Paracoccaceae bacterium]
MKNHLKTAIVAATALSIAAPAFAQTELSFWSWRQEDIAAYGEIIEAFEADHPEISVTYTAHEAKAYNTILTTALAGGSGPDIIHTRAYGSMENISGAGYLEPLDGQVDLSLLSENELLGTTLRADGKVYAVPFASQTVLVYYNSDIFEAQGISAPETWDEFLAVSQQLKDAGITPLANGTADGWTIEVMSGAFMPNFYGSEFFGEVTSGATTFEDDRYVAALGKMAELAPFMPNGFEGVDYATMKALFTSGAAAMFVGGSWEINGFRDAGVNFEIMPGPAAAAGGERMVATWMDGGYAVNAASENKEAALDFIRFTATTPFAQMLTDKLNNIAAVDGAVSSDATLQQVSSFHSAATPYIMLVAFRFDNPTGSTLLQNGLQALMTGAKTASDVAADVAAGIAAAE